MEIRAKKLTVDEVWRSAKGYKDVFEVSTVGNVRSLPRKIIQKNGHPYFVKKKEIKGGVGSPPADYLGIHVLD